MDLFELYGKVYLIVIDYYSRWIESKRLDNLSTESVVYVLKEIFASHGIPDIITSDNGPQFSAPSVCNELYKRVCACNEFPSIPLIEWRGRTGCVYHEWATGEERQHTHRFHGIQIDAASDWAISSIKE